MSRDINQLTPEMALKANQVKAICASQGVDLLIYYTLRSLKEQAVLYRQSRTVEEINRKVYQLRSRGFGFLATVLIEVGPQSGPWATNAAPGESWHNYAEAFDAVPVKDKKPLWDYDKNKASWDVYGAAVEKTGLVWGGKWRARDYPHAQLQRGANPLELYKPDQVQSMLVVNGLL